MREKIFKWLAGKVTNSPQKILIITAIITVVMFLFARNLDMELSWVGLAPKGDPSQAEYTKILKNYPSASKVYVTVEDKGNNPEQAARIAAERLEYLDKYVESVSYKMNTDYMLDNGLLLYKSDESENITTLLQNPNLTGFVRNLNQLYEREYQGDSQNIKDDQQELVRTLRGLKYFIQITGDSLTTEIDSEKMDKGVSRLLTGDPYLRSINGDTILMTVQPTFGIMDFQKLKPGVEAIEKELNSLEKANPGFDYGLTGMHVVGKDEMVSSTRDSTLAMIIGLILVLIILITAFKMWLSPLLTAVPLIVGIIWDMGLTSIFIGSLNLFTVFTAAILIGLGIDFSVHILSGYTEARSDGYSASQSVHFTLEKVGPGILTGALTTAAAFFTLTISSLGFLVELGIIMGMGIITTALAVFMILPPLLYLRTKKTGGERTVERGRYPLIGSIASW